MRCDPSRREPDESAWSDRERRLDAALRELLDPEPTGLRRSGAAGSSIVSDLLDAFFEDQERFDRLVRTLSGHTGSDEGHESGPP